MVMQKKINKISIIYLFAFFASVFLCSIFVSNNLKNQVFADEINITAEQINQYLQQNNTDVFECNLSTENNIIINLDQKQINGGILFRGNGNAIVQASENLGTIDASNKNITAVEIGENCNVQFRYINIIGGTKGAVNVQNNAQFFYSFGTIRGGLNIKGVFNFYAGFIDISSFEMFRVDGGIVNQAGGTIAHQKGATVYLLSGQYTLSGGTIISYKTTAIMISGGKFLQQNGVVEGMASVAVSLSGGEYCLSGGEVVSNNYSAITILGGTFNLSNQPTINSFGTYCDIYKSGGVFDANGYVGKTLLVAGSLNDSETVVFNVEDENKFIDANSYGKFIYDQQNKKLIMQKYKINIPTIDQIKNNNGVVQLTTNFDEKITKIEWLKNDKIINNVSGKNYKPNSPGEYFVKIIISEKNVSGFGDFEAVVTSEKLGVIIEQMVIKNMPTKTKYEHGDGFDEHGMVIQATLNSGHEYELNKQDYCFEYQNSDKFVFGDDYVVIKSLQDKNASAKINVTISKRAINLPTNLQASYTGENLLQIVTNEWYVAQNDKIIDVGEYQLVLELVDKNNTFWNINGQIVENQIVNFVVEKAQNSIKDFKLKGWESGDKTNSPTATASFGEVEFLYSTSKDGEYSKQMPSAPGKYYAKAIVYETNNYTGAECVIEFEITQNPVGVIWIIFGLLAVFAFVLFGVLFVYFRKREIKVR